MLGYPTAFTDRMFRANHNSPARDCSAPRTPFALTALVLFLLFFVSFCAGRMAAQVYAPPPKGGVAELSSSGPQKRQGDLTIADGAVDIHYGGQRLQADHVEYNEQTNEAMARGHVVFDYENQHLEADEAHYNVSTGRGTFT